MSYKYTNIYHKNIFLNASSTQTRIQLLHKRTSAADKQNDNQEQEGRSGVGRGSIGRPRTLQTSARVSQELSHKFTQGE